MNIVLDARDVTFDKGGCDWGCTSVREPAERATRRELLKNGEIGFA